MSFCHQETITDKAFKHLKGIHTLNISNINSIIDKTFEQLEGISSLDISCCNQNTITNKIFNLELCSQTTITKDALLKLEKIEYLNINYCPQISNIQFNYFKTLKHLCSDCNCEFDY